MAVGTQAIRGNVGVLIKVNMQESMVGATGLKFQVEKPKGQVVDWLCSVSTNFLIYTTTDGDIDQVGEYKISPVLTLGSFDGRGKPAVDSNGMWLTVIDKHKKP